MELWQWHCRNRMEKKNLQLVCGNAIAEIGVKKKIWEKWNGIRQYHCHNSIPLFFFLFFFKEMISAHNFYNIFTTNFK